MFETHCVESSLECREVSGGPGRLIGIVLPAGRVASDRSEIFIGQGIQTPAEGIALLPEHRSKIVVMHFDPIRDTDGSLRVDHLLPDTTEGRAMAESVRSGATSGLSVEFHALSESRANGGRVREIQTSLVTAVATVPKQSYTQSTVEIRARAHHRRVLTWL